MTDHVHFARRIAACWRHALAALAVLPLSALAGYALPSTPPGFAGSPGSWTFTPPANAPTIGGGAPASNLPVFRGPGPTLPSAGGGVPTSAAFRVGAGGARALAGRAVAGLIPGLGLALAAAWLFEHCYEKQGGSWVRTCGVTNPPVPVDGFEYRPVSWMNDPQQYFPTKEGACEVAVGWLNANAGPHTYSLYSCTAADGIRVNRHRADGVTDTNYARDGFATRAGACPAGWYVTPAGCVQNPPPQTVTEQEVVDDMATKPLPNPLPLGVPYPLDPQVPFIFNPTPGDNPQGQPMRLPQGNPVPIPNTNPQQYRQPVTRWAHSPSPTEPWRMSADPQDVIGTDPQGMTEPQPETGATPNGSPPEKSDLCADHPDILACQKVDLDTPEGEIPKETRQITYAPESVFGGGSCPPPVPMAYGEVLDYSSTCDNLVTWVRPMVIAIAGWIAIVIIFGVGKPE